MKDRFVKVVNGDVKLAKSADGGFTKIVVVDSEFSDSGVPSWWVIDTGEVRKPTQAELDLRHTERSKASAKEQLNGLYKQLRGNISIEDGGEIYSFDEPSKLAILEQVKKKASGIKVYERGKKINKLSKVRADALVTNLEAHLDTLADAYNDDFDLIEISDFTIPNLTAIELAQKALNEL
jgi:hypothetical protein